MREEEINPPGNCIDTSAARSPAAICDQQLSEGLLARLTYLAENAQDMSVCSFSHPEDVNVAEVSAEAADALGRMARVLRLARGRIRQALADGAKTYAVDDQFMNLVEAALAEAEQ